MVDFLIIGQGLAGSLLAWELIQRGCKVLVVDNGEKNASQVAAGVINPVTGMRFVKSDNVDLQLPVAISCYAQLSDFFQEAFFIEKPMVRIFKSERESDEARKRLSNPDYQPYLNNIRSQESSIGSIATPCGYLEQKQNGYLLTQPLLNCLKAYFISRDSYCNDNLSYQDIQTEPTLSWKGIYPGEIIFCEGYKASRNPWFSWLPFEPVKGEILTLRHETILPDKILNYGNWLIPLNDHQIRIGATFDRENLDTLTTEEGKNELLKAVSKLSSALSEPTLINHQANIRPCTSDRHPFIGKHPKHKQLAIFNGFGAKGSLQIPWFSQCFADHLLSAKPLPASADIGRHLKKHYADQ